MSGLDDALHLAALGWAVFPCELTADDPPRKVPIGSLVERGFRDATTHPRRIGLWWRVRPDALVGVALPPGTVVADVDDRAEFATAGLELPDAPEQVTRSGGLHRFYSTNGHEAPVQQVKTFPGVDTRVGGKGYVIAWDAAAFPSPVGLPLAPEWVYAKKTTRADAKTVEDDADLLLGEDGATHRDAIVAFAGRLRWAGQTAAEILGTLRQARADGRIVDGDPTWPWSDEDFRQIAKDLGSKPGPDKAPIIEVRRVARPKPELPAPARQTAVELLALDLRPLEYIVEEILPEGLGVVAGAPKVGKSWLTFQAAVEIATGGELLGHRCEERPVLYYGLEDGERRFQKRLRVLIADRRLDLSILELRYVAPRIGAGLEDEVAKWLDDNDGGVVFIDILAKIRPTSTGKGNAYDEDYAVVGPLQRITRDRPGTSLIVVTHDRKAGSEDFLTTVTGTRGVTGAADWIWVVKRARLEPPGTIYVTGRDIERDSAIAVKFDGPWELDGQVPGTSEEQRECWQILRTDGDGPVADVAAARYPDDQAGSDEAANHYNGTWKALEKLVKKGEVTKSGGRPTTYHAVTADERLDAVSDGRSAVVPVRRVRAPEPARARKS